jgi:uncharacterized damage-inducible protein DinB
LRASGTLNARKLDGLLRQHPRHAQPHHSWRPHLAWLARFAGEEVPSINLDTILYEDSDKLRGARAFEDERIETFASGLGKDFLGGKIRHLNNEGKVYVDLLVAHLFNHQTHHRGQVHDMLTQTNVPPPVLDLHRVINSTLYY